MGGWELRAAASLIPLSGATSLRDALAEWRYLGRFLDLEQTNGVCELCGQQDLRYHFEIVNRLTSAQIMVGSECIKRFDLSGINEEGREIDPTETARLVNYHHRGLVENARQRRMMTALLKLGQADASFDALSFLDYVDGRGAFTPNQLALMFWRFQSNAIAYRQGDFKLTIRRNREIAQLRTMSDAAFRRVKPSLSSAQRALIEKIKKRIAEFDQVWR